MIIKESNLLKRTMGKCVQKRSFFKSLCNGYISINDKILRSHFEGPILKLSSHEYGLQLKLISINMTWNTNGKDDAYVNVQCEI